MKKEVKIKVVKTNKKIDEIVKDYPLNLNVHPRVSFEEQLKKHLLKHGIK